MNINNKELITIYNTMIENNIQLKSLTINYQSIFDYKYKNINVLEYLTNLDNINSYNMTFLIEDNMERDDDYQIINHNWRTIDIIFHGYDNHHLMINYLSNFNLISNGSSPELRQLFNNPWSNNIQNKFNVNDINMVIEYVISYIKLMDDTIQTFETNKNKFSEYFY